MGFPGGQNSVGDSALQEALGNLLFVDLHRLAQDLNPTLTVHVVATEATASELAYEDGAGHVRRVDDVAGGEFGVFTLTHTITAAH